MQRSCYACDTARTAYLFPDGPAGAAMASTGPFDFAEVTPVIPLASVGHRMALEIALREAVEERDWLRVRTLARALSVCEQQIAREKAFAPGDD